MARKLRLEYAGATYHVINRGNYRQNVFEAKGAAEAFERCLGETCERFGWMLHAYVIMRNHFHLAVETPEPNLSAGMKWLQGTWANRFNRYRGLVGRPFQGRYKALHVEPGQALAQVANYIHLNPVRAKVVAVEKLGEFRWSSFWWFPQRKERPAWLCAETVLTEAGGLADTATGWRKYGEYLGFLDEAEPTKRQERYGKLSRGWALGTAEFKQGLIADLEQRGARLEKATLHGETEEDWRELREAAWEKRLLEIAAAAKIDLGQLGPRKSDSAKVLLAAALRAESGVSNRWLTMRLGMGTPASVSQFVRRWQADSANAKALVRLRNTLSKVTP
jgi:REP element-mobilizing transposase RayT